MIKFPSIEQFRNVIKHVQINHDFQGKSEDGSPVYQHLSPYPVLRFQGTVKLHGTNAGIVKYKDRIEYQSRERVLSLTQDNSGFMLAMMNKDLTQLFEGYEFNESIAIFGEWSGAGIQKGVAISQVPKMFVIFACQIDGKWITPRDINDKEQSIYSINQFPMYKIEIDFNNPQLVQNELCDLTIKVEEECPVGKYFGVSGVGEGIVWSTFDKNDELLIFKVKGEKHSSSKVKTLAEVDIQQLENIDKFVELVLTESRLSQGITYMKENNIEIDVKTTGKYLSWIIGDVIKEETDTIVANQLNVKSVGSILNKKAREWYFNYLKKDNEW